MNSAQKYIKFIDNFNIANQNHMLEICDRVQGSVASDGRVFVPRGTARTPSSAEPRAASV